MFCFNQAIHAAMFLAPLPKYRNFNIPYNRTFEVMANNFVHTAQKENRYILKSELPAVYRKSYV